MAEGVKKRKGGPKRREIDDYTLYVYYTRICYGLVSISTAAKELHVTPETLKDYLNDLIHGARGINQANNDIKSAENDIKSADNSV